MKNYIGQFECRLCLTTHISEANYLAHTQGRKHKQNLAKQRFQEEQEKEVTTTRKPKPVIPRTMKIGQPGFTCKTQRDPATKQYSILIQINYPRIKEGIQPRFRFRSAYEYAKDDSKGKYQFVLSFFM